MSKSQTPPEAANHTPQAGVDRPLTHVLEARHLAKHIKKTKIVNDVSIEVKRRGENDDILHDLRIIAAK